ncbi:MAG: hypothetical protein ACTHLD_18485 [Chitinophaga sp.]
MPHVFGVKMYDVFVMVTIEFLGAGLGWGVNIAGHRWLIFRSKDGGMEASYYKVPEWLTADDIDILREIVTGLDNERFRPWLK